MAQNKTEAPQSREAAEGRNAEKLVTADEIIAALSGVEKATTAQKSRNENLAKDLGVDAAAAREKAMSKLGKSRGFTLADIEDPKATKPQPKFAQAPDSNPDVRVGEIRVDGKVLNQRQNPQVAPKPNLGKLDISNIPAGEVIDPKTGRVAM